MNYNPERQYRASIIRGRAKKDMDNLLPVYATILEKVCPCKKEEFPNLFNRQLEKVLVISDEKTLHNHRTEIAGKLFGMYFEDKAGVIHSSKRSQKLLQDRDQPAFFKDICYKFQFPSGAKKIQNVLEDVEQGLHIRQCAYIVELLRLAQTDRVYLSTDEIGYYVLNSLDVLQGKVTPIEVLRTIVNRRGKGIIKKVYVEGKASSYSNQHIRETLNYLELTNLIKITNCKTIILNTKEGKAIDFLASSWNRPLDFDVTAFDLDTIEGRHEMYREWSEYYSKLSAPTSEVFETTLTALTQEEIEIPEGASLPKGSEEAVILGDEGEVYIYRLERARVEAFNSRLKSKVLLLGRTKGLGFDIQSVRAVPGPKAEHAIYIEVKSTKRVTVPSGKLIDSVILTRNEWVAAEQHGGSYKIYRVYFTSERTKVFVIDDPVQKNEQGVLNAAPLNYQVDFTDKAGRFIT
jgi:hypothetical protein